MTSTSTHRGARRVLACAGAIALTYLALPTAASAQLSAAGPLTEVLTTFVRGVDVAADPSGGYMVVASPGPITAVCVNAQGQPTTGPIVVKPAGSYGAFPRAIHSPQANGNRGAFLVVWTDEGAGVTLHARLVSCSDGVLGTEQVISGGHSSWLDVGVAAVGYSPISQRFLAVWKTSAVPATVQARLVDLAGVGVGGVIQISNGFGRDPAVAWNPNNDEFAVSFSGENPSSAFSVFVRIPAANPTAFSRSTFNVIPGAMTQVTDIDYNSITGNYVMAWREDIGGGARQSVSAEIDPAGNVGPKRLVSTAVGSYDALSLAFNAHSKTFLLAGVKGDSDSLAVAELDGSGSRFGDESTLGGSRTNYTRVAASATHSAWNSAFAARSFSAAGNQVVQTGTVGGPGPGPGPAPTPTPTPPPAVSTPRLWVDSPANGARVSGNGFDIAGWAIDAGSTSGPGVNMVHIWAYPTGGGSPIFLGAAAYGSARGDVAAAFGSARFTPSGFGLGAQLPPGMYDIAVFPHSTVAAAFTAASVVRVTVEAPTSIPRMWVDTPAMHDNLSQNVRVSGWAVDLGSPGNSGVDAVHVWAHPTNGGPPVLVGTASVGWARPDVGNAFGAARFANSGFTVEGTVPRGDYNLVVYAHSSVVNAFNNVFVIPVRVN